MRICDSCGTKIKPVERPVVVVGDVTIYPYPFVAKGVVENNFTYNDMGSESVNEGKIVEVDLKDGEYCCQCIDFNTTKIINEVVIGNRHDGGADALFLDIDSEPMRDYRIPGIKHFTFDFKKITYKELELPDVHG